MPMISRTPPHLRAPSLRATRASTLTGLFALATVALLGSHARAEEPRQECANLLEKSSDFARFDATYPQARADLGECAAGRCSGNRALVEVCKVQLKKLDDTVPIFVKVVGVKAAAGAAHVLVDGEAPAAPTLQANRGFRVKAGAHTLVVKADGYTDAKREVTVDPNGDEASRTFELRLSPASSAATPAPVTPAPAATASSAPAPTPAELPPEPTSASGFPYRPVGVTLGIVGLLGVGAGFVAGATAMGKRDDAGCNEQSRCPTDSQTSLLLDAKNWGNASTIFVVAGGALFATGIVFILLKPSDTKTSVAIAPAFGAGSGGMLARGTF